MIGNQWSFLGGNLPPLFPLFSISTNKVRILEVIRDFMYISRKGETLKRVNRTGWALAGVSCVRQESVGEHSFGTVMNSLLIAKLVASQGIDVNLSRVVELATFHDLPEALTSDIPRTATDLGGDMFRRTKEGAERNAIGRISKASGIFGDWILDIWKDMEDRESIEARIVLGADIVDMLIHALSLESSGVSPEVLNQFFTNSREPIDNLRIDVLKDIYWELYEEHINHGNRLGVELERISR
jgi:putative hydrolase of HD superfamily